MEYLALCVSILSLTVSSVAYFRSGGARDIRALEQRLNEKVERLNAIAHRVSDSVAGRLRAGYMQSIRMISDLQSQVVGLKEKAAEEVNEDLRKLAQTLDGLAGRAVREAKELKGDVSLMMVEAEISLRLAVDEAKARLRMIEAKQELSFARKAINENDLKGCSDRPERPLDPRDDPIIGGSFKESRIESIQAAIAHSSRRRISDLGSTPIKRSISRPRSKNSRVGTGRTLNCETVPGF